MFIAQAQRQNNLTKKIVPVLSDTIQLDSLSIIPGSEKVFLAGLLISNSLYTIEFGKAFFVADKSLHGKILEIQYRTFSINFTEPYFHKDYNTLSRSSGLRGTRYVTNQSAAIPGTYFSESQLQKQGSISRGISFGNNQDLVVNSSLNLQMSGRLNNEFEIRAAITDDNIPIQPDGTSQQIQEFDKVFIQVFNSKTSLTVGDFEINSNQGKFLRIKKKSQGALFSSNFKLKENKNLQTNVGVAVSKGQYHRVNLQGIEGNQGPYKLFGANNESYIIVIAGSEKVYIDGKLLERGLDNDYTIDYNQAQVFFTPNQLITKDSRITIEFEYSDKNYARFMLYSENNFSLGKGNFRVSFFSNQDSKNQPLQQDLNNDQRQLLKNIGDSLHQAVSSTIEETEFSNDWIMYKSIDTLVNGVHYSPVYKHSTNPDSAHYRLGFSFVGLGNGNYIQKNSLANGRVYAWVIPASDGSPQGDYEPVILLVTPKKKQVLSIGGDFIVSANSKLDFELALSNNDINTFSKLDSDDNVGVALNIGANRKLFPANKSLTGAAHLQYQMLGANFDAVENFRPVEFSRDWNLSNYAQRLSEHLLSFEMGIGKENFGNSKLSSELMQLGNQYKALKNNAVINITKEKSELNLNSSLLNSTGKNNQTVFFRNNADFVRKFNSFKIGIAGNNEFNQWKQNNSDSLLSNSFSWYQANAYLQNSDTSKSQWQTGYTIRKDLLPKNNSLSGASLAHNLQMLYNFKSRRKQSIKTILNYRKLQLLDTSLTETKEENTINSRFELNLKYFRGAIRSSVFYEIGSGLELKKEYSFVPVSPGQGVYIWNDYNGDGNQQLDEFEQGIYQDTANYIRVFIPGNNYEKILSNQVNLSLILRPERIWSNKKDSRKILSKFSNHFVFRADRKNTPEQFWDNANPFLINPSESGLRSINSSIRNTFSFKRAKSKFGADYIVQKSINKLLLVNGFDTRSNFMQGIHFRWKIFKNFILNDNIEVGNKVYSSEVFSSKNYEIESIKNEFVLTWEAKIDLTFSLNYYYTGKQNISGTEKSDEHKLGPELTYKVLSKANLRAVLNLIAIDYNENTTNTPIAYEMLGGLKPGTNITWEVQYQQKLAGNLQVNLNYSGRKSEANPIIHIGGVQLRAYF